MTIFKGNITFSSYIQAKFCENIYIQFLPATLRHLYFHFDSPQIYHLRFVNGLFLFSFWEFEVCWQFSLSRCSICKCRKPLLFDVFTLLFFSTFGSSVKTSSYLFSLVLRSFYFSLYSFIHSVFLCFPFFVLSSLPCKYLLNIYFFLCSNILIDSVLLYICLY